MMRTLLLAAVALNLMVPVETADAASQQKKNRQHKAPAKAAQQPPYVYPWAVPVSSRRRGPPWAMPNECYNDEGYGRWTPCTSRDF